MKTLLAKSTAQMSALPKLTSLRWASHLGSFPSLIRYQCMVALRILLSIGVSASITRRGHHPHVVTTSSTAPILEEPNPLTSLGFLGMLARAMDSLTLLEPCLAFSRTLG